MIAETLERTECMQQSPDVHGVIIDFGNAPAHGRWRAISMMIGLVTPCGKQREIKMCYRRQGIGDSLGWCIHWTHAVREPHERVEYITLTKWELTE